MIDAKLQAELRAKYNPEGSDLRKVQLRMLKMLKYIDAICRDNNIKYWLSSGTCLGAVRHGGFIPWDDDCDIEMLEKDYKKFRKIINSKKSKYILQDYKSDKSYYFRFGKLRDETIQIIESYHGENRYKYNGVYIDIFRMEYSSSKILHKIGWYIQYVVNYKTNTFLKKNIYGNYLIQYVLSVATTLLKLFQLLAPKKYLRHSSPASYSKGRSPKYIFPLQRIKFENVLLNAPGNTNGYLTELFNNYSIIPSKIHTHNIIIKTNNKIAK